MPARPSARPPASQSASPPAALDAFRHALYPILRARDADAFRRLLADSEDLLGDTGEVAEWPEARVRALMGDLLREPARFGLPHWPAPGADPGAARTAFGDPTPAANAVLPTPGGDAETVSMGSSPAPTHARAGSRPPPADAAPAHEIGGAEPTAGAASADEPGDSEPTADAAPGAEARAPASGVRARSRGPRVKTSAPAPGAAPGAEPAARDSSPPTTADPSPPAAAAVGEPSEAPDAPGEAPPKPRSGRRPARRAPPEQLSLW